MSTFDPATETYGSNYLAEGAQRRLSVFLTPYMDHLVGSFGHYIVGQPMGVFVRDWDELLSEPVMQWYSYCSGGGATHSLEASRAMLQARLVGVTTHEVFSTSLVADPTTFALMTADMSSANWTRYGQPDSNFAGVVAENHDHYGGYPASCGSLTVTTLTEPSDGTYTYVLDLDLADTSGNGWGDGSFDYPRLEISEGDVAYAAGTTERPLLGYASVPTGKSHAHYQIKTNDIDSVIILLSTDQTGNEARPADYNGKLNEQVVTLRRGPTILKNWNSLPYADGTATYNSTATAINSGVLTSATIAGSSSGTTQATTGTLTLISSWEHSPATSTTLTLDLTDDSGDGWGDDTYDYPRIRVYEGTNDLGYIWVEGGGSAAQYTIETYDKDAISLEWEVDDSWTSNPQETNGYICEQTLTLKEGSTTLFSLDTTGDPCGDDENETYSNDEKLYPSGTPNAAPSTGGTLTEVSQS